MASVHQVHVRNGEDCVEEVEETLLRASAGLSSLTDKVIMEYLQYLHPCLQVSQYTFAICSYKEKKSEPSEMLQMDGYTVDYIEPAGGEP